MNIKLLKPLALILLIFSSLSFQGCVFIQAASINKQLQALIDQPKAMVIAQFGMPTGTYPDGKGGEVWVYQGTTGYTTPGSSYTTGNSYANGYGTANYNPYSTTYSGTAYGSGYSTTTYNPPTTGSYPTIRSFFINKQGIVYAASWHGV